MEKAAFLVLIVFSSYQIDPKGSVVCMQTEIKSPHGSFPGTTDFERSREKYQISS
jgi:hypothetical protein